MKQVFAMLIVLLVAMGGYLWLNGRLEKNNKIVKEAESGEVYFVASGEIKEGEEGELELRAKDNERVIKGFDAGFNYDSTAIKILEISVNSSIFDENLGNTNDESLGKATIRGESGKSGSELGKGEIVLAKIKIKAIKKGTTMFYRDRAAIMKVETDEGISEVGFEMPDFKLNIL